METKTIVRVNNVDIIATSDEQMIAIRPICEALGIDAKVQRQKIQEDEDLNSVGVLSTSTGADGKKYEMLCLPVRYIFGWLFTINPKNVKPEAQEAVRVYRRSCYDALYQHFFGTQKRQLEQNRAEPEPAATAAETDHCRQAQEAGAASQRTPEERTATVRLNE